MLVHKKARLLQKFTHICLTIRGGTIYTRLACPELTR